MRYRRLAIFFCLLCLLTCMPVHAVGAQEDALEFEGQIAYIDPEGNLLVLRAGWDEALQVTSDAEVGRRYLNPRWSPDGSLLAFCQENTSQPALSKLFFLRTGEWLPFALVEDVYCTTFPLGGLDWTPDGRKITYARNFEYSPQPGGYPWSNYSGIWTVDILSGERQEILPSSGTNPLVLPAWSPDQVLMRFYEIVYIEGSGLLQTWNSETDTLMNWLGSSGGLYPGYSSWSPDGSQLAFDVVSYAGFPGAGLYRSSPDGSTVNQFFYDSTQAAIHPIWSPAGDMVAFHLKNFGRNVEQPSSVAMIQPDGINFELIGQGATALIPVVWSPSGSQLLYGMDAGEWVDLFIYDRDTAQSYAFGPAGDWNADWSVLPPPRETGLESQEEMRVEDFPTSLSVLLYVGEGYQLILTDPASGLETPLTDTMRVAAFWPSPTGQRLVYGNTLMLLDFLPDDSLQVRRVELPAIPDGGKIGWAPDEERLAIQAEDGQVWMVDSQGAALPVPGAAELPVWSADSRWVAYCDADDNLNVIGPGAPPEVIAEGVVCDPQWSPDGNLLAYTLTSEDEPGNERVHVYDVEASSSHLVMEQAILDSWSPDGTLLAVRGTQAATGVSNAYTVFAVDPRQGRQLVIGTFQENDLGLNSWSQVEGQYIFGPYLIAVDLSNVTRLADALLSVTPSGSRTLVGIGQRDLVTLACARLSGGEQNMLATYYLTGIPNEDKPGVWGWLSPDGDWSATYNYEQAGFIHQLRHCEQALQVRLPPGTEPQEQAFSPDSRWHIVSNTDDQGSSEVLLHDLENDRQLSLPAAANSPAIWLQSLELPPPETYTVTGQISVPNGGPIAGVQIKVNGVVSTTTDELGEYAIGGMLPGDYTIRPQLDEYAFSPPESSIRVPHGPMRVDFYGSTIDTGGFAAEQAAPEATPEPLAPLVVEPQAAYTWLDMFYDAPMTAALPVLLFCAPVLLLLVLFFALRRRRRRKRAAESIPLPDESEPEVRALPMPADAQSEVWLREGVALAKQGKNKEALRTLRKVVRATPDNPTAWLWLGLAAARSGDARSAERCFKRAERLGHPKAQQALEWLGTGGG